MLLNGNKIFQDTNGFLFGIDAVLLYDFAKKSLKKDDFVVDLCSGNAVVPLLLEKNILNGKILGVEIQKSSFMLAQKSIKLNNLQEKIDFLNEDLKNIHLYIKKHSVNFVTCNPPYMILKHGKQNFADEKAIARHEIFCKLEDIITAADFLLKTHGVFCMIHRPFRLPEIFSCLKCHNFEPKRMKLVFPFIDKQPNLVLIEARKNAKPELKIEPPLIVRENSGMYTKEINEIYKFN